MRRWLLPEAIVDTLPLEARQTESLRRILLDEFDRHGYDLVAPPLLEYLESLLTGSGGDLDLRTFKLVDQLSGRTMGLRADITPQAARIDAHLLNRPGVVRLCYCGPVLHALPADFNSTREPLQIGAELYGHGGLEADAEVIRLLAHVLQCAGLAVPRIDLGHVGVFRALAQGAGLSAEAEAELFAAMQAKDLPLVRELVAGVAARWAEALLLLPECYGAVNELAALTARLPDTEGVARALRELEQLAAALAGLQVSFDLADLRGDRYHSGVVFAAYVDGEATALARGGRYDEVGRAFGRARPATGFSLDLRQLARAVPAPELPGAILAPAGTPCASLQDTMRALRARGERVIHELPGHAPEHWRAGGCDRRLIERDGAWVTVAIAEENQIGG
ncbi:MAG: ATP phosphoribosyltransferase regulatory subunit [Rhodocyclaceae bacterium]|nr:ATP phosphoribosyltransferase regulatory subunit [Rhodocyclaceae bacterium]MBX3669105.1 ATP phosphoribosyltransferase regulatory subunit [Rhodocyclaceae bacterium]